MDNAPQSTINHNAVIELASDLKRWPHATAAVAAGAQKAGPPCPRGGLKSAGTMPKSHPRRNAMGGKKDRFRKLFARERAIFFDGIPRNGCKTSAPAAIPYPPHPAISGEIRPR